MLQEARQPGFNDHFKTLSSGECFRALVCARGLAIKEGASYWTL